MLHRLNKSASGAEEAGFDPSFASALENFSIRGTCETVLPSSRGPHERGITHAVLWMLVTFRSNATALIPHVVM